MLILKSPSGYDYTNKNYRIDLERLDPTGGARRAWKRLKVLIENRKEAGRDETRAETRMEKGY